MGASCTCATECAIVWWFQCRLLKYRETDRYREIVVTRVIQLWAASAVALLAGGYTEHWITTTSLKRVEQIIKSILQGTAGNQVILSCQVSLKNATCVTCLCAFFFFNSCTYQSMQSDPIIASNLYFLVSHHTVAALFVPLTEKSHLSQFWPALSFGPLPVGPLICTEWNILLWWLGIATCMLMPECGGIRLDSGTFARHLDYRCNDVKKNKKKTKHERQDTRKTNMQ